MGYICSAYERLHLLVTVQIWLTNWAENLCACTHNYTCTRHGRDWVRAGHSPRTPRLLLEYVYQCRVSSYVHFWQRYLYSIDIFVRWLIWIGRSEMTVCWLLTPRLLDYLNVLTTLLVSFQTQRNIIVLTVFSSILNQMEFCLLQN